MTRTTIAGAVVAAFAIGAVGSATATATAHADTMTPGRWCAGDPKQMPYAPTSSIDWDWSVCHTWYPTNYGMGNVTIQGRPTSLWDGDNPPPEAVERRHCPPIAFLCP